MSQTLVNEPIAIIAEEEINYTISLEEFKPSSPQELPREIVQSLVDHPTARIEVRPDNGGWVLKPNERVGIVSIGNYRFLIRPKIGMKNLLNLLCVTPKSGIQWSNDLFDFEDEDDPLVALIRMFRRSLDQLLIKGLRRDYIGLQDNLISPRGRLDIKTISRRPGPLSPIPCDFDEYSLNVRINQLLVSAIEIGMKIPGVPGEDTSSLRRHLMAFDQVERHRGDLDWARSWEPGRSNSHYQPCVIPAALIIGGTSISDHTGSNTSSTFLLNMNDLVEKFVEVRLRDLLPPEVEVQSQGKHNFDLSGRVSIFPDLVFKKNGRVFVADVKYKDHSSFEAIDNKDIYQINAYVQTLRTKSGALISCSSDPEHLNPSDDIRVVSNNSNLKLWPVDLSGSASDIELQMVSLAERIEAEIT